MLIEERLEGPRLGIVDVYRIMSEETVRALGQVQAIAYVDVKAEGDLMKPEDGSKIAAEFWRELESPESHNGRWRRVTRLYGD